MNDDQVICILFIYWRWAYFHNMSSNVKDLIKQIGSFQKRVTINTVVTHLHILSGTYHLVVKSFGLPIKILYPDRTASKMSW